MLIAKERLKALYFINSILPIVFWGGIIFTVETLGIRSYAVFKLVAFAFSAVVLYRLMIGYLNLNILKSIKLFFYQMLLPLLFLIIASFSVRGYLPLEKSKLNLLIVAIVMGGLIFISFVIQYFASNSWRQQISKTLLQLKTSN